MMIYASKSRCWPLIIQFSDGGRVVFPEVAPCDDATMRALADKDLGLLFGAILACDDVSLAFLTMLEAALNVPAFVEALKERGAAVLQPGESLSKAEPK
jgi:hypothetical protein